MAFLVKERCKSEGERESCSEIVCEVEGFIEFCRYAVKQDHTNGCSKVFINEFIHPITLSRPGLQLSDVSV